MNVQNVAHTSGPRLPEEAFSVLLVEDDPVTLRCVEQLLVKCQYEVTTATNGREAMEILEGKRGNTRIDLILTDILMPEVDGMELIREVTQCTRWGNVPVIVMSSQEAQESVMKAFQAGASDYLIKPIRRNELSTLWQHAWKASRPRHGRGAKTCGAPAGPQQADTTTVNQRGSSCAAGSSHEEPGPPGTAIDAEGNGAAADPAGAATGRVPGADTLADTCASGPSGCAQPTADTAAHGPEATGGADGQYAVKRDAPTGGASAERLVRDRARLARPHAERVPSSGGEACGWSCVSRGSELSLPPGLAELAELGQQRQEARELQRARRGAHWQRQAGQKRQREDGEDGGGAELGGDGGGGTGHGESGVGSRGAQDSQQQQQQRQESGGEGPDNRQQKQQRVASHSPGSEVGGAPALRHSDTSAFTAFTVFLPSGAGGRSQPSTSAPPRTTQQGGSANGPAASETEASSSYEAAGSSDAVASTAAGRVPGSAPSAAAGAAGGGGSGGYQELTQLLFAQLPQPLAAAGAGAGPQAAGMHPPTHISQLPDDVLTFLHSFHRSIQEHNQQSLRLAAVHVTQQPAGPMLQLPGLRGLPPPPALASAPLTTPQSVALTAGGASAALPPPSLPRHAPPGALPGLSLAALAPPGAGAAPGSLAGSAGGWAASSSGGGSAAAAAALSPGAGDAVSGALSSAGRAAYRSAAVARYREKRKNRTFDKKVRYESRKRLAESRPRVRGQFVRRQDVAAAASLAALAGGQLPGVLSGEGEDEDTDGGEPAADAGATPAQPEAAAPDAATTAAASVAMGGGNVVV